MTDDAKSKLKYAVAGTLSALALVLFIRAVFFGGPDADRLADSVDPGDRLAAIEILRDGPARSRRGGETLRRLALDENERVAVQAVRVLARQPNDANFTLLAQLAQQRDKTALRSEALAALGNYEQTPLQLFEQGIADPQHAKVREGAYKGLARRSESATIPILVKGLRDPDPHVRAWAITGLSNILYVRFPFDASQDPKKQEANIQNIENYLRRNGKL